MVALLIASAIPPEPLVVGAAVHRRRRTRRRAGGLVHPDVFLPSSAAAAGITLINLVGNIGSLPGLT